MEKLLEAIISTFYDRVVIQNGAGETHIPIVDQNERVGGMSGGNKSYTHREGKNSMSPWTFKFFDRLRN